MESAAAELSTRAPGDVLDRRLVADSPDGTRMEWHLVVNEDDTDSWTPRLLNSDGDVIEEPVWMPLPGSQFIFLQCPVYEALLEGPRAGGKTISLIMDFAREVGKDYGSSWRGVLFRREYKDLDDVVKKIEEWFPRLWPGFRFLKSKAEYMAIWPTGEALLLRVGESEDDFKTFKGHEYPWIGFEELTEFEDDGLFMKMQSCSRSSTPGLPCRVRSTTNPHGPGHGWVRKRYGLPRMRGRVINLPGQRPRVTIHSTLQENFLLLHATPDYVTTLRNSSKNPNEIKAWIEGDWNITAGGMIDDLWREEIHVLRSFSIDAVPRGWTLTRAYDHGQARPFAVGWFLESNGESIELSDGRVMGNVRGDVIMWREWYGTSGEVNTGIRMSAKRIAQGIFDREEDWDVRRGREWTRSLPGPADTEIYNPNSDRDGKSPADDMEAVGIYWERADKSSGSRKRGWTMMRTMLEGAVPADDGTREDPGFFVCEDCAHWIELVPPMPRDTKDQDDVPKKYEDHCLHSDTMIMTAEGNRKIADLVGRDGEVMTAHGWASFVSVRRTRRDADVVQVTLSDGYEFVCTPDHEIMLSDGRMIAVVDAVGQECYNIMSCQKESWSLALLNRSSLVKGTISVATIFKTRVRDFTEWCGNIITATYRRDAVYTTSTMIALITRLKILRSWLIVTTWRTTASIMPTDSEAYVISAPTRRLSGIDLRKAEGGTKTTIRKSNTNYLKKYPWFVKIVNQCFLGDQESVDSVPTGVNLPSAGQKVRIWLNRRVDAVVRHISLIDIGKQSTVVGVVRVEPAGRSDVYCLTVPGVGHFSLANGVLVSNCADMTRYRLSWEMPGMWRRSF